MDDSTSNQKESQNSDNSFFFHFSKPLTDSIDNGSFFKNPISWLYTVIAIIFLLIPFVIAFKGYDEGFFDYIGLLHVIMWIILLLVCFIIFQIWINRKNQLLDLDGEKGFLSTTIMSNFISTCGECYGVVVGIGGTFFSLLSLFSDDLRSVTREFNSILPFGEIGLIGLIMFPVLGFIIVIVFRFFSELIMGIAQIARNTANLLKL